MKKKIKKYGQGGKIKDPRQDSYYIPSSSDKKIVENIKKEEDIKTRNKGTASNPVNLPEFTITAPRQTDPNKKAFGTVYPDTTPPSSELASTLFMTPLSEYVHTPSRVVNYGVGAIKNKTFNFNPYQSELSKTLGLEHRTDVNDSLYEGVRDFFVDYGADMLFPMSPKTPKQAGTLFREQVYKAIDPVGYGAKEKILSSPKTWWKNTVYPEKRALDVGKELSNLNPKYYANELERIGQNRLDAWRVGLKLDQKWNTFEQIGDNTYRIKNMSPEPGEFSSVYSDMLANQVKNESNGFYTEENPLVTIAKKHDKVSSPIISTKYGDYSINDIRRYLMKKGDDIKPWEQYRIVENAKNPEFQKSVYDADRQGIMGSFRWDIKKPTYPNYNIHFQSNDLWNLNPFEKRGAVLLDPSKEEQLTKHFFKPLQNLEALELVGGKPFNIQNNFIVDPKTYQIKKSFKQGGKIKTDPNGKRYGNKDWSWHTSTQIPINQGNIYKKDWLMGYKPVEFEEGGEIINQNIQDMKKKIKIKKYTGGGGNTNWDNINTQAQYPAPGASNVIMPEYQYSTNQTTTPSYYPINNYQSIQPNSNPVQVQPPIEKKGLSAGANYGINFATNLAGKIPEITSSFTDPNATAGDKTRTTAKGIGDAAVSAIPGFGQFYGLARGATSAIQGALPSETKYDPNSKKPVKVIKTKTSGQKTAAAFDQLLTPDHEHAANSWGLAADSKNTLDKVKYGFQGIGDLFGVTKVARMSQAAMGKDPDGRKLLRNLPNQDSVNSPQNPFNQQEGNLLENLNNNPVMANYGGSLRSMSKYNHGGDLEHYDLPLHKDINPDFANAHLDKQGVQINAKETIHRKKNGGDYVFTDSIMIGDKTAAEHSKKIEAKTKKPYFDPASIAVREYELGKLERENDIAREQVENKQYGRVKQYVKGGGNFGLTKLQQANLNRQGSQKKQPTRAEINNMLGKNLEQENPNNLNNNLTTGDYLQLAGSTIAPLANIAMSMRKPEKVKAHLDNTQYGEYQIGKDYNPLFLAENSAARDIDNQSMSDSVRRAARTSLASNTQSAIGDYAVKVDNANKMLKMQQEQARAGTNRFNSQVLTNRDVLQSQTNAARMNYLNAGLGQLGQSTVDFGKFKNEGLLNQMKLSSLNEIATNYKIDPDTLNEMYKNGIININWKTGKITK